MPPLSKSENKRITDLASRTQNRLRAQYRPTAPQKDLLVRAASLVGQTISDFMRTAIEERARRVIADHDRIVLNEESRKAFLAALVNPPQPNDRLVALMERYAREVTSRP